MNKLSTGRGPERYVLRFPIDLAHNVRFKFETPSTPLILEFLGREVSVTDEPYGAMLSARDFSSESEAASFAAQCRIVCQALSIADRVAVFTDAGIFPVERVQNLVLGLGSDAPTVHGVVPGTLLTIFPDHEVIVSHDELRGKLIRLLSPRRLTEVADSCEAQGVRIGEETNNRIDAACNFWSLACANQNYIVAMVNVVAALEVLATYFGIRRPREPGLKELIEFALRSATTVSFTDILASDDPRSFSKKLYRQRNELIHRGVIGPEISDLHERANRLARRLILMAMCDAYGLPASTVKQCSA